MTQIIISGGTIDERTQYVMEKYPVSEFDHFPVSADKASIGIEQIHDLIHSLTTSAQRPRVMWIQEADLLTVPAQNALLKILEEPPAHTYFILSLSNVRNLLPTVTSRCTVEIIREKEVVSSGEELALLKSAFPCTLGERIQLADSLGRKKDILVEWTHNCLRALETKMSTEKNANALLFLAKISTLVHTSYIDLKTNVNPGLTMQHLFVSLPHTQR